MRTLSLTAILVEIFVTVMSLELAARVTLAVMSRAARIMAICLEAMRLAEAG